MGMRFEDSIEENETMRDLRTAYNLVQSPESREAIMAEMVELDYLLRHGGKE
jgi:hypothetical protein